MHAYFGNIILIYYEYTCTIGSNRSLQSGRISFNAADVGSLIIGQRGLTHPHHQTRIGFLSSPGAPFRGHLIASSGRHAWRDIPDMVQEFLGHRHAQHLQMLYH